jgi:hypothetical protein
MIKIMLFFSIFVPHILQVKDSMDYSIKIHKSTATTWQVSYSFNKPVTRIQFNTSPLDFRIKYWQNFSNKAELITENGSQNIVFPSPTRSFKFEINQLDNNFYLRQYTPFIEFSDKSSAIYLGHYYLAEVIAADKKYSSELLTSKLQLSASKKTKILYKQKESFKKIKFNNITEHEYAYFGQINTKSNNGFKLIIDPNLPKWLLKSYTKAIPKIFDYYSKNLYRNLNYHPLILIAYDDSNQKPRYDGGALFSQLALNFVGDAWKQDPEKNRAALLKFVAHEIAHLWNSYSYNYESANESYNNIIWMHEGGADALAYRALLDLGLISNEWFENQFKNSFEPCAYDIYFAPINGFDQVNKSRTAYSCGAVISLLFEKIKKDQTVFDLWQDVFTYNGENSYSQEDYFEVLKKHQVQQKSIDQITSILNSTKGDRQSTIKELFSDYGYQFTKELTESNKKELGISAFRKIMGINCNRSGFWTFEDHLKTEVISSCTPFNQEYNVSGISGYNLFSQGDLAYDYLLQHCGSQKDIELNLLDGKTTLIKCDKVLKESPQYINLLKFPNN